MTTDEWLVPRLRGAPPELASAVRELVDFAREGVAASEARTPIPDRLADAAIRGLEGVLGRSDPSPRSREAALRLLAADALLTYAFEAAADLDTGVDELADRLGPDGTFGSLLLAAAGEGRP